MSTSSGGEKARLALAKVLKRRPNFLLLDEPTNHMDIVGKEALETLLLAYTGSVLLVSHDRYFVQRIADELLVFEQGCVTHYPFGYDRYLELQSTGAAAKNSERGLARQGKSTADGKSGHPSGRTEGVLDQAEARLQKYEKALSELEATIAGLKKQMESPEISVDYVKLLELNEELKQQELRYNKLLTKVFGA